MRTTAERFVRSLKCIHRMIFVGEASRRHGVREYVMQYPTERTHQGYRPPAD